MKKLFIITTLILISCGNNSPSACDCAEMSKERIESKMETLTKKALKSNKKLSQVGKKN